MSLIQQMPSLPGVWLSDVNKMISAEIIPGILTEIIPGFPMCDFMGICRVRRFRTKEEEEELERFFSPDRDDDDEEGEAAPDEEVNPESVLQRLHTNGVLPKCGSAKAVLATTNQPNELKIFFMRNELKTCLRNKYFSTSHYLIPVPCMLPEEVTTPLRLTAGRRILPGNYGMTRCVQGWSLTVNLGMIDG
jgi:hypothetical protein